MTQRLKAVYQRGAFVPREACNLPEDSEVELVVEGPYIIGPRETDPEERKRILKTIVDSMRKNPFPPGAPRFDREQLHDRR